MNFTEIYLAGSLKQEKWRQANIVGLRNAADILNVDVRTLRRWHAQGIGPKRQNWEGRRPISYLRAEVEEFAATYRNGVEQTSSNGHLEIGCTPTSVHRHSDADLAPTTAIGQLEIT